MDCAVSVTGHSQRAVDSELAAIGKFVISAILCVVHEN